jgi:hypothetical protein
MTKLIYLASPYSDPDENVRKRRFEEICEVSGTLMSAGNFVFCPIAHTHPIAVLTSLPTGFDYWEEYDTRLIVACDELWVCTMDGWDSSIGVTSEIKIANANGKPTFMVSPDDPLNPVLYRFMEDGDDS